jgi:Flp pilus assembly protein TadB
MVLFALIAAAAALAGYLWCYLWCYRELRRALTDHQETLRTASTIIRQARAVAEAAATYLDCLDSDGPAAQTMAAETRLRQALHAWKRPRAGRAMGRPPMDVRVN